MCERSVADGVADVDMPQHRTWTEDEPWRRSLSSRAGRFPKTLFALSRCRIPKAKGFGHLLSCSPVYTGARDREDYGGGAAARGGKPPTKIRSILVAADRRNQIRKPTRPSISRKHNSQATKKIKQQKKTAPLQGEEPNFDEPFTRTSCPGEVSKHVRVEFPFSPHTHSLKRQR